MFSTLDRIDVFEESPDGIRECIQMDHRAVEEIEQLPELSVIFALARVLNAKRLREPGAPDPLVTCSFQNEPPEFLQRAIRSAGGGITIGSIPLDEPDEAETPPLDEFLQSAFADMGMTLMVEYGVPLTEKGLQTVEEALAEVAGSREENELAY